MYAIDLFIVDNECSGLYDGEKDMMVKTDSTKSCCTDCYSNIISVGGKYYFNT